MSNRPTHFEIPVDDVERAQAFWSNAFGWRFQRFGEWDYWMVMTGEGPGIDGGIMPIYINSKQIYEFNLNVTKPVDTITPSKKTHRLNTSS